MPADDPLLDDLAALVRDEAATPPEVLDAAKALHDWHRIDAVLAEPVPDDELALVRAGDDVGRWSWRHDELTLTLQVEPSTRGRRLATLLVDRIGTAVDTVRDAAVLVQFADGRTIEVVLDDDEAEVDVPAGTLRLALGGAAIPVVTTWVTV